MKQNYKNINFKNNNIAAYTLGGIVVGSGIILTTLITLPAIPVAAMIDISSGIIDSWNSKCVY